MVSLDGRFGLAYSLASAADTVTYELVQKGGSELAVYTLDCATPGDKWQLRMGKQEPMAAVSSGSTSNWFSPALVKGNGAKTATINYLSGNNVFPVAGVVKFVQPSDKRNQQLTVSR